MPENNTTNIPKKVRYYWDSALAVVNAAGKYAAAIKLKANLQDDDTAWKVQNILEESFAGSMANLEDAILYRRKTFYAKVEKFNIQCMQNGVHTVTRPNTLLGLLIDQRKRASFRKKILKRLKKGEICSLQSFEMRGA